MILGGVFGLLHHPFSLLAPLLTNGRNSLIWQIIEEGRSRAVESAMASDTKTVAVVLFGGFELLDVAAPVEFFGALGSDVLELCYCRLPDSASASSAVSSSCLELRGGSSGPDFVTTHVLSVLGTITSISDGTPFHPNIVFVPGEFPSLSLSPLAWTD